MRENYDANSHRKKKTKEEGDWPEREEWPKSDWGDAEYYEEFNPGSDADDKRIDNNEKDEKDKWGDAEYYEG